MMCLPSEGLREMMNASGLTLAPPKFHFRWRSHRSGGTSQRNSQALAARRDAAACPLLLQRACLALSTQRSNAMIVRAMSASVGDMSDDSSAVFPRINVKDPYKRLGINRMASEDEIQGARNFLIQQYAGHKPSVDAIESAHDKIIMQKFHERKNPKIDMNKKIRQVRQSKVVSFVFERFQTPPTAFLVKTAVTFAVLGALTVLFPTEEGPTLQVDQMVIHSASDPRPKTTLCGDYFYNYFTRGMDILFDGETHRAKKFVLHTNYPGHADFNSYIKCNFVISVGEGEAEANRAGNRITPRTNWEQVKEILGECGPAAIQTQGSTSNPFGSTYVYGYQNVAFEVMKNECIAVVTVKLGLREMMNASGLTLAPPKFHFRWRSHRSGGTSQRNSQALAARRDAAACPLLLQRACLALSTQRSNAMIVRAMSASVGDMSDDSSGSAVFPRINYAGHKPSVDAIESAHDKIIMQKFHERKNPKIDMNKKIRQIPNSSQCFPCQDGSHVCSSRRSYGSVPDRRRTHSAGFVIFDSYVLLHPPKAQEEALVFPLRDWLFHLLVADWDFLDGVSDPALHQRTKRFRGHVFALKLRFALGSFQLP
ncbi:hypothetical protein Bca52824_070523 [Brassica carinata]|uniref:Uncharacterized protein n=1 Tax=Brassica carinata TaxID=52824 RepID=A0A8X7U351_BRACI|nr:hypothetical protein Bca52824_070523 [Brassica carinata]